MEIGFPEIVAFFWYSFKATWYGALIYVIYKVIFAGGI